MNMQILHRKLPILFWFTRKIISVFRIVFFFSSSILSVNHKVYINLKQVVATLERSGCQLQMPTDSSSDGSLKGFLDKIPPIIILSKKPSAEKSSPRMVADQEMLRPKWWQIKKLVRPTYSFLFV